MADFYYFYDEIDKNGNHEVHNKSCSYLPSAINRTFIGYENNCHDAIDRAKREHPSESFDGCYWCSKSCHTG